MKVKKFFVTLLLTVMLLVGISASTVSAADACERFVTCGGPADCAWWGVQCAEEIAYLWHTPDFPIYW